MTVVEQQVIPSEVVAPVVAPMESFGLSVWIYRGADWYVRDMKEPHVDRESWTVQFAPTLAPGVDGLEHGAAKVVGVCDDHQVAEVAAVAARAQFGEHASVAYSQPYYLDVPLPQATKDGVVKYWSTKLQISPEQIATIGDIGKALAADPDDIEAALTEYEQAMFARSTEAVTFEGTEVHGIDSENNTAQAMLKMINE